ncbi:MAG: DUF2079 domain-containing protein, partial [Bacteroidales bacterium]
MSFNCIQKKIWEHKEFFVLAILVFALYSLISFPNHYFFRTSSTDLGAKTQALYSVITGKIPMYRFGGNYEVNTFADHFSPILFLFAPFVLLFGSYTLLGIQVVFLIIGGLGVYKYALYKSEQNKILSVIISAFYFCSFGVINALEYDAHYNVIVAGLVSYVILYYEKNKKGPLIFFFLLIILAKENMSFWL